MPSREDDRDDSVKDKDSNDKSQNITVGRDNLTTQRELLKNVLTYPSIARKSIVEYRFDKLSNNKFLRNLWKQQYMCSGPRVNTEINSLLDEVSDVIAALPVLGDLESSTSRRITRAMGKVLEYPNVQIKTIEYKPRK